MFLGNSEYSHYATFSGGLGAKPKSIGSDELTDDTTRNRFVLAFIVMQLTGAGGLTLILLTALVSKHVKRHPTWYNFTVSWIFSCLCYCLLFLAGQQVGDPPDETLCGVQAALVYAAPVL